MRDDRVKYERYRSIESFFIYYLADNYYVNCNLWETWEMKKTSMPEFKPGFWASYYECLKFTTLISMVRTTLSRDIISLQRTGTCIRCFRSYRRRSPRWRCRRNGLLINPCYYYETYTSFYKRLAPFILIFIVSPLLHSLWQAAVKGWRMSLYYM